MERVMIAAATAGLEPLGRMRRECGVREVAVGVGCSFVVALLVGCGDGGSAAGHDDDGAARTSSRTEENSAENGTAVSQDVIATSLKAAEQYFHASRFDEAEAILLRLIDRAPAEAAAYELYGRVQYGRSLASRSEGRSEAATRLAGEAYKQYAKATELDSASSGLQHAAAMMAMSAGRTAEAIEHLERAVALDPLHPQYPLHLAQLYLQTARTDEAVRMLERVLTIDPEEPYAHATLAGIALERGDFDEALTRIELARSVAPGELALRVVHARIARRTGHPTLAVELLTALPEAQRTTLEVTRELEAAYIALESYQAAASVWAERFASRPNDWRSAVQAGRLMLDAGELEEALSWLGMAEAIAPTERDVQALADAVSDASRDRHDEDAQ